MIPQRPRPLRHHIKKIISGGQTGVDRAALDAALKLGLSCGGWCPKGRLAEDGPIPSCYSLQETPTAHYPQRTEWNVRDSDATLLVTQGQVQGGTALTLKFAKQYQKPHLLVDLTHADLEFILTWLSSRPITVLNIAGPRESTSPGIYAASKKLLLDLFVA